MVTMGDLDPSLIGHSVGRDECAFYHERSHWKKDYSKLKNESKHQAEHSNVKANFVQEQGGSFNSDVSLFVTPFAMYANDTYWNLDTGAIYHICLERE